MTINGELLTSESKTYISGSTYVQGLTGGNPFPPLTYGEFTLLSSQNKIETQGNETPQFNKAKREGQILKTNYFHQFFEEISYQPSVFSITVPYPYRGNEEGDYASYSGLAPDCFGYYGLEPKAISGQTCDDVIDYVKTKSLANMDSSEMMLLASLAELGSTRNMLVTGARRVFNLGTNLKEFARKLTKSKTSLAVGSYRAVESAWMELRMGWRPFIGEMQTLHKVLTKIRETRERQKFRAQFSVSSGSPTFEGGISRSLYSFKYKCSATQTFYAKAGCLAVRRHSGFPDTYGLTKIPETIWELTPCSWAVDYFFNVGDVIAAYTPDTLWESVDRYVTTVKKTIYNTTSELTSHYKGGGSGAKYKRTVTEITRLPVSLQEKPTLTFLPKMNWKKYIDTAFVARQQFGKGYKAAARAIRR